MKVFTTDKIRNVVVLGHSGAGKTSLVSAMNGIATASKQRMTEPAATTQMLVQPILWDDHKINILDVPGAFDFVGEIEEAVGVADAAIIVISGTTAETYLIENYPDIPLQKFDSYATAKEAFENGTSVAWANDNTEVIAFSLQNKGYTVGIPSIGSNDSIAPAVTKGNDTLLDWINEEIKTLGEEQFFHADYEETLKDTYGSEYEDSLVVEGGETK